MGCGVVMGCFEGMMLNKLAKPTSTTQISSHSSPGTGHTPRRPQEHAPQRKQGNMHLREEEVKRGVAGGSIEHN